MAVKLTSSSVLHHTHFTLIHSPPHSLTYMESHGCMLSFTPSHTQLTQASISIQPTKPVSPSKLSPTYGILPKKMPRGSPSCDAWHSSFHSGENPVRPTFHLLRMSHIRNSVRPTFHLIRIFHIWPDAGWERGRFNFPSQTCPDPLMALTRIAWLVRHS